MTRKYRESPKQSTVDLGQNSLLGAQLYSTGRPAAAIILQNRDITPGI